MYIQRYEYLYIQRYEYVYIERYEYVYIYVAFFKMRPNGYSVSEHFFVYFILFFLLFLWPEPEP